MKRRRTDRLVRPGARLRFAIAAAIGGLAIPASAGAAEWDFNPRVTLAQTWTDNVALEGDGLEESEWITELTPGLELTVLGPRVRALLDYQLQALWFADNSDLNDVFHELNGNGNFVLAPDTLFLDAFARYDQQNIDTGGRRAYSNLFTTDNRADVFVIGASPYHVGRWGAWGESLLRYSYQGVQYSSFDEETVNLEDSTLNAIAGEIGTPESARGFRWRLSGDYSQTEFDEADEFEYARAAVDFGLPVGLRSRVTATIGQESDVAADPTKGGLDYTFWFVGFATEPSELQRFEARVGDRYYGTAWELHWSRRGSRGEFELDYTEEPTTSSGVLGDNNLFDPDLRPGGIPSLDPRVFLRKRASANASYRWVRSTLRVRLFAERREYDELEGETERSYGGSIAYDWDAAARTRFGAGVDWERLDTDAGEDDYVDFNARVTREITRTLSGVFRVSHFFRNAEFADDYTANLVSLSLEARF